MMAAEQWYEYQDSYKKYGLDMKPRKERIEHPKGKSRVSAKDKTRLMILMVFVGIMGVAIIIISAYAAGIKYDINSMIKENNVMQGEIERLKVDIMSVTNIETIEARAVQELGMTAAGPEQMVFLGDSEKPEGDFAVLLKAQAYN